MIEKELDSPDLFLNSYFFKEERYWSKLSFKILIRNLKLNNSINLILISTIIKLYFINNKSVLTNRVELVLKFDNR